MSTHVQPQAGHPRRWAILGVLVISLLVVVLDNTVLNVAMRTIADPEQGLGASQSELEWAINSYTLVFAGLLFTAGILADRLGRRISLVFGLIVFGLASLFSAYATSPDMLIAARAVMGLGAAAVMPATLSIIANVFDPKERPRAIGVWAGAVGLAVAIGPVLGGVLLEHFWWGSVFLINVPIVVIGVALVFVLVPESKDPKPNRIDVIGVLLSIVGLTLITYGVIKGGEDGFGEPLAWGTLTAGLLIMVAFVLYEKRITFPSLDVRLFTNRQFSASTGIIGLVFFAAMGSMFFGAFYLQMVRGYGPLASGALFVPFALGQMIFAPLSAGMVKRFGPKAVSTVGLVLVAGALALWVFIGAETPIWIVAVTFFVQGVGMANVMPPATEAIMSALPREKAGVGSAVSNTIRQLGGALGVAVLGAVVSSVYRSNLEAPAGLPDAAADLARESIAGAYAVAGQAGSAAPALLTGANEAFVTAMHYASVGSTVFALLGALVAALWLPGKRPAAAPAPAVAESPAQEQGRELADAETTR
ncbi:putative MFS transporter [Actinoplanes missouriensis 431]|uniref:Putative MFS transporter n=1 Tax=Actinoplanes missouriensis (strain ATCC 14538 / DSM 43046 / CBS 188.64 / JCM 3121 / NBRC 102363 / NCIMB 12654 / NRRL B-3342 / UNCC 431) TaxID=512565 RepID=I0HCZ9_ACTM4|nr:MFS transporter [Actinoplanes missouriensis]BAL90886.1 putative MFS transporter [Actinoplanes missouriensis 431]